MTDESALLRERIRDGTVQCHCIANGSRRGFKMKGDRVVYDGIVPQAHGPECEWDVAVRWIYELERADE